MLTPEGKVKSDIKKVLAAYKPHLYALWPVQNGMGSPTLDCLGVISGFAFAIEAKAPGKKPTPRQDGTIELMRDAGCKVFVIDGDIGVSELDAWLRIVHNSQEN
jgi:hypothetical protein